MIEVIGLIGNALIISSLLFSTENLKGALTLRSLNLLGSIIFIFYGISLNAVSIIVLNSAATIINTYHIINQVKLLKSTK